MYSPPPAKTYHRHITFNDDAMVRLMIFLREVATDKRFEFVDHTERAAAQRAFDQGVDCILKCQIKVDGKLTAWCAQHDEVDFIPRPARTFELVSLSGSESVGIVRLLMSLDDPSPQIVESLHAAVAWFESAKLTGIKIVRKDGDKAVVADPAAPPLWARFYDIQTNKPVTQEEVLKEARLILKGNYLKPSSRATIDPQTARPLVTFELNGEGAKIFGDFTSAPRLAGDQNASDVSMARISGFTS